MKNKLQTVIPCSCLSSISNGRLEDEREDRRSGDVQCCVREEEEEKKRKERKEKQDGHFV